MNARGGGRVYQNRFQPMQVMHKTSFPPVEIKRTPFSLYPELDVNMAKSFLYATNFSKRDYQFDISLTAVKENTLVVIPTGLGKTFIAAVIILNYYRWFPNGKVVFLATSRPLVGQQMASIRDNMKIDPKEIIELTGSTDPKLRSSLWEKARIVCATPQTVQNDIEKGICPAGQIVLLIIDEAHHATGDHSYCKVVSGVAAYTKKFRVVGLSATPGNDKDIIQDVIYGLMISRIEYRTDNEYKEYTKTRDVESIIIEETPGVDELSARLNTVIKRYLTVLHKDNFVPHTDPVRTSKGQIAMLMKNKNLREATIPMTATYKLLQFRDYLQNYSIKIFVNETRELIHNPAYKGTDLAADLFPILNIAAKQPQIDPKMNKLCEIVVNYLQSSDQSRIIVFCNFRKIVQDIVSSLSAASPLVKCSEFVGQAKTTTTKGLNQGKQIRLIESFRKGIYNTLVATAIGEEGLDIGEVDLIICYDMQKSMTRTIQRMGRTGRKRDGKVIFLLNEMQQNLVAESDNATSNVCDILRTKMKDFVFYPSTNPMNPYDLEIVERALEARDLGENVDLDKKKITISKRKTLTTDELSELESRHGDQMAYRTLSLTDYMSYQIMSNDLTHITHSSESRIFSSLVNIIFEAKVQSATPSQLFVATSSTNSNDASADHSSPPLSPSYHYSLSNHKDLSYHTPEETHDTRETSFADIVLGMNLSSDSSSDEYLFAKKGERPVPDSPDSPLEEGAKTQKQAEIIELLTDSENNSSESEIEDNYQKQTPFEMPNYNAPVATKPKSSESDGDEFIDGPFRIYSSAQIDKFAQITEKKEESEDEFCFVSESEPFEDSDPIEFLPPDPTINAFSESDEDPVVYHSSTSEDEKLPKHVTMTFSDSSSDQIKNSDESKKFVVSDSSDESGIDPSTNIPIASILNLKTQTLKERPTTQSSTDSDFSLTDTSD